MKTPTTLIIMDGYGLRDDVTGNAVRNASTPCLDELQSQCPSSRLSASGRDVGLPDGQMGNSEVGHTNIGAGRVVYQDLPRISKEIEDGAFFRNEAFLAAMSDCRAHHGTLHLMGLLSDGGVHSHNAHLYALLRMAKEQGVERVLIHVFLDGRDVTPTSGHGYVAALLKQCETIGTGQIASVMGRYYAMDRDKRWERVQRAYDAIALGEGAYAPDPLAAVEESYTADVTDEFVVPVVCVEDAGVHDGDAIIFFNFRPDRARELTRCFVDPALADVTRPDVIPDTTFVCMTEYDTNLKDVLVAYPRAEITDSFGAYLSRLGLTQLRIAETEKYAHVTFFFNGGAETVFDGEARALIPSPKVATYDLKPEMSAPEVTAEVVRRIESGAYDVIILNYANCDMVGHTGVYEAAVKAVETVDACVGKVVEVTSKMGGITMITADHGNAEQMTEADGAPFTAHTTNPVPFILVGADVQLRDGRLSDIAPTMLDIMGLEKPEEMTGVSLIIS